LKATIAYEAINDITGNPATGAIRGFNDKHIFALGL
jgi:hypothetical protein